MQNILWRSSRRSRGSTHTGWRCGSLARRRRFRGTGLELLPPLHTTNRQHTSHNPNHCDSTQVHRCIRWHSEHPAARACPSARGIYTRRWQNTNYLPDRSCSWCRSPRNTALRQTSRRGSCACRQTRASRCTTTLQGTAYSPLQLWHSAQKDRADTRQRHCPLPKRIQSRTCNQTPVWIQAETERRRGTAGRSRRARNRTDTRRQGSRRT